MNTFDCTQYYHSNLVPNEYELDDYQVRTPTDIIGQHIHLPKWDLTTADGAANGWNYEDGTLSFMTVEERITAINHYNADPAIPDVPTIDNHGSGRDPGRADHLDGAATPRLGHFRRPGHDSSAGLPTRWSTMPMRTAGWGSSSPTTTTGPRPTSRSGCTPRC